MSSLFHARSAQRSLALAGCLLTFAAGAFAQGKAPQPDRNNWTFAADRSRETQGWLFVTIRPEGDAWAIHSVGNKAEDISKESPLEPFLVSRDFQRWSNYYTNRIANCDSFAVQDSPVKNVCSSRFAGTSHTKALIGTLFGGSGVATQQYDATLVNTAIRSIDPEEAERQLRRLEGEN